MIPNRLSTIARRTGLLSVAVCLVSLGAMPLGAQNTSTTNATETQTPAYTPPASSTSDSLTIGPGDVLAVHVLEIPELDQKGRVTDDGLFPLNPAGNVRVQGLTPGQAAYAMEQALAGRYVLNPHISVVVEQYAGRGVTVIGQVRNPGSFSVGTTRTILDVLALAGGLTEFADHTVTIQRRDTGERINFVVSNRADVLLADLPLVHPGDTVFVPRVYYVYMLGDVNRPGGYPAVTNDNRITIVQALATAGGTPPTAMPSQAKLVRKGADGSYTEMDVQLSDIQKGKKPDFALQPDDIVFIPYSYLKNIAVNLGSIVAASASAVLYTH
jgi:polysaccharide export outer membrane protein